MQSASNRVRQRKSYESMKFCYALVDVSTVLFAMAL